MDTTLSIVIATYNVEKELIILFESLRRSIHQDFVICICDDHSKDRTLKVINNYKKSFSIKTIKHKRNLGVSSSRNSARKLAKTKLLLFLDADIRIYPDTIPQLITLMRKTNATIVQSSYSSNALDKNVFSQYYAFLINHSFRAVSYSYYEDTVFNGWCCLCQNQAFDSVQGHTIVNKGIEIENETLGRKIIAAGYKIITAPSIPVDHHWGGARKLHFIFTKRVYWWIKVFFVNNLRFEKALTNGIYGFGTLGLPLAIVFLLARIYIKNNYLFLGILSGVLVFIYAYGPFYLYVFRKRDLLFVGIAFLLSTYFSFIITFAAGYSFLEEFAKLIILRRTTLSKKYADK